MPPKAEEPSQVASAEVEKAKEEDRWVCSLLFGPKGNPSKSLLITKFWYIILAMSALLDSLAVFLAHVLVPVEDDYEEVEKENPFLFRKKIIPDEEEPEQLWYANAIEWLETSAVAISILFSVLWFVDAFLTANRRRVRTLQRRDRKRLLEEEPTSPVKKEEVDVDGEHDDIDEWLMGAWGAYFAYLFIQLIFLPIGFYILIASAIRSILNRDIEDDVVVEVVYSNNATDMPEFHETLSTHTTESVAYAFVRYGSLLVSYGVGVKLNVIQEKVLKPFAFRQIRHIAFSAIRNPLRFKRRLRKFLTFVRWFKYLAPLVGTGNKLLGNTTDLIKKYRQHLQATKAQRIRKRLWRNMSEEELEEHAAIVIQSWFRARQTQKAVRAVRLLKGQKESFAAIKLQKILRAKLAQARVRLRRKAEELKKLEESNPAHISKEDRRRMYQLQEEVGLEAKEKLEYKVLLRPNTRFAVTWKVLFVICVIIEISILACQPMLAKYKDEDTGKPLDVGSVLEHKLVPKPITEWKACARVTNEDNPEGKKRRGILRLLPRRKKRVTESHKDTGPWYCYKPYTTAQSVYREVVRFLITEWLAIVGLICFMDVFVTFFTGELDENGSLVPKAFFTRWILPGLCLQLIVNPRMETVSAMVSKALKYGIHVGPVRLSRWAIAFYAPALRYLFLWLYVGLWLSFVHTQNIMRNF